MILELNKIPAHKEGVYITIVSILIVISAVVTNIYVKETYGVLIIIVGFFSLFISLRVLIQDPEEVKKVGRTFTIIPRKLDDGRWVIFENVFRECVFKERAVYVPFREIKWVWRCKYTLDRE